MLREINASQASNTASHQFSNSALRKPFVEPRESLVQALDAARTGESDQRKTGHNTTSRILDNFVDYLA